METLALILNGVVVNIVIWDGVSPWTPDPSYIIINITSQPQVQMGWIYNGASFSNPNIVAENPQIYTGASGNISLISTPTDIVTLAGNATTTVTILRIELSTTQITSGINTWFFLKRSMANSGGTFYTIIGTPTDSNNIPAVSSMLVYTANPILGTLIGNLAVPQLMASSAADSNSNIYTLDFTNNGTQSGIVLHGVNEVFAVNFNGVAIPVGLTVNINIMWSEV